MTALIEQKSIRCNKPVTDMSTQMWISQQLI